MTEDNTLSLLKQASVFIRGPDGIGSGCLVAPQRIATALHVVRSWQQGRHYEVQLGVHGERRPCQARLIDSDAQADVALLAFDEAVNATPLVVRAAAPDRGARWDAYGYSALTNAAGQEVPDGQPLSGTIDDPDAGGRLLLYSDSIGAGSGSPLRGFSGSPVLVDGQLVGQLTRIIGDSDDASRPAYGKVYATPARALQALLAADRAKTSGAATGTRDALDPSSLRDADALHVLVVMPPGASVAGSLALDEQVQQAWEHQRRDITAAVNGYRRGLRLPPLPESTANGGLVVVGLRTDQALSSKANLRAAVRALCRCEAALFDLTGYDPGVMFLLGIRSVARRGVTLASIGGTFTVGNGPELPFNLQLLNLASHSKLQVKLGEGLRPHQLISGKLVSGFSELASLPHYLDLPAYESVRQLGGEAKAYQPIPYTSKVLVLCPFGKTYTETNWELFIGLQLADKLKEHARQAELKERERLAQSRDSVSPAQPPREVDIRVERLLEVRTPRLVAQSLYEAIRLVDLCIIDWTECRPNVMFEAGVRLATNALGAVHIIDAGAAEPPPHVQTLLQSLNPVRYRCASGKMLYDEMISRFETSKADFGALRYGEVFSAVGEFIDLPAQSVALPLADELIRSANLLSSEDEESAGIAPVLFSEVNKQLTEAVGHAAAERRLAAWLFIRYRYKPADIAGDATRLEQFQLLSAQVRRWARKGDFSEVLEQVKAFEAVVNSAASKPEAPP